MSDLVGNPEDRFSHNEAQIYTSSVLLEKASYISTTSLWRNNEYYPEIIIFLVIGPPITMIIHLFVPVLSD